MTQSEPLRSFNFALEMGDVEAGRFIECSGIGADVDVIAYREGGANANARHLAGQTRFHPVTLRFGLTSSPVLWEWFQQSMDGVPERRNVSVILFDHEAAEEAFRWNLVDAWISGWKAARLDAAASDVAVETLTLVYDALDRD